LPGEKKELPKYVESYVTTGPVDYYLCELCKGRVDPMYFQYHLETKHSEVTREK